jgi:hypothetical protein
MRERQQEWVYQLTAGDVTELEAALGVAERTGKAVQVGAGLGRLPKGAQATPALAGSASCVQRSAGRVPRHPSRQPAAPIASSACAAASAARGVPLSAASPFSSVFHPPAGQDVVLEDFPLPQLGPKLRALLREVAHGRGFQLLSGVPVDRWTQEQAVLAYWWVPGIRGWQFLCWPPGSRIGRPCRAPVPPSG